MFQESFFTFSFTKNMKEISVLIYSVMLLEVQALPRCDLSAIFRTPRDLPRRNYDHLEIIERANFNNDDSSEENPQVKTDDKPKSYANAQILLRIGCEPQEENKKMAPKIENRQNFELPPPPPPPIYHYPYMYPNVVPPLNYPPPNFNPYNPQYFYRPHYPNLCPCPNGLLPQDPNCIPLPPNRAYPEYPRKFGDNQMGQDTEYMCSVHHNLAPNFAELSTLNKNNPNSKLGNDFGYQISKFNHTNRNFLESNSMPKQHSGTVLRQKRESVVAKNLNNEDLEQSSTQENLEKLEVQKNTEQNIDDISSGDQQKESSIDSKTDAIKNALENVTPEKEFALKNTVQETDKLATISNPSIDKESGPEVFVEGSWGADNLDHSDAPPRKKLSAKEINTLVRDLLEEIKEEEITPIHNRLHATVLSDVDLSNDTVPPKLEAFPVKIELLDDMINHAKLTVLPKTPSVTQNSISKTGKDKYQKVKFVTVNIGSEKPKDSKDDTAKKLKDALVPIRCVKCDQKVKHMVSYPVINSSKTEGEEHSIIVEDCGCSSKEISGTAGKKFQKDLDDLNQWNGISVGIEVKPDETPGPKPVYTSSSYSMSSGSGYYSDPSGTIVYNQPTKVVCFSEDNQRSPEIKYHQYERPSSYAVVKNVRVDPPKTYNVFRLIVPESFIQDEHKPVLQIGPTVSSGVPVIPPAGLVISGPKQLVCTCRNCKCPSCVGYITPAIPDSIQPTLHCANCKCPACTPYNILESREPVCHCPACKCPSCAPYVGELNQIGSQV